MKAPGVNVEFYILLMRNNMKPLPILLTILFAYFTPIKSHATAQIPNYIIHKGKTHILEDNILYPYLAKANKWEWIGREEGWCTALARGYYVTLEIVNNELVLKRIKDCDKSLLKEFLSAFNLKDSIFKLDWFTGSIVIGENEPLYEDMYEYYSRLNFENGILIKETRINYKEYLIVKYLERWLESKESPDKFAADVETFHNWCQRNWEIIEHYLETKKEDKSEFLVKLKMEYEKKFGEPISDFELKIHRIEIWSKYYFQITRTLYGARIIYYGKGGSLEAKLSIKEWLDFIRALFICCPDKWQKDSYGVLTYFSSKDKPYDESYEFPIKDKSYYEYDYYHEYDEFPIKDTDHPSLKKFEKVIESAISKIRENLQ
jgi:hypothetical protein